jgi:hypothetical protein
VVAKDPSETTGGGGGDQAWVCHHPGPGPQRRRLDPAPASPLRPHAREAEDGASTPILLARSRHASVRSLERYARPGVDAVGAYVARRDPAARRRPPGVRSGVEMRAEGVLV